MPAALAYADLALGALALLALAVLALRRPQGRTEARLDELGREVERVERALREDIAHQGRELREEVGAALKGFNDSVLRQLSEMTAGNAANAKALRDEVAQSLRLANDSMTSHLRQMSMLQQSQLESFAKRIEALTATVEERLKTLQTDNASKLDQMRHVVDEKLQGTLEKRLGESFRLVSDRLEQVHKGLGEMQTLASGVGDLKRVLSNVKTRGTWGEIQLGNLLEQMLTPEQFARDVATRAGSAERVEFAIRLPGRGSGETEVLLPIDAKFPREDYERLTEAADRADGEAVEQAARALEARLKQCARDIRDKYLNPPRTTDFAIMFLPTEGLYAEVLRRPGLVELLQRDYRVSPAGPTTLGALLNSLQMGFRTLAIEKRSSEVWEILGAVKTEFGKYGEVLDKVKKKLDEASNTINQVEVRKRAIDRKLRQVQEAPAASADALLGLAEPAELEAEEAGA